MRGLFVALVASAGNQAWRACAPRHVLGALKREFFRIEYDWSAAAGSMVRTRCSF